MAVFDLEMHGPLHLGGSLGINREATLEWIPSDTFFAALVTIWVSQGIDITSRLEKYLGEKTSPPMQVTSLFPQAGKVRFYPAPPRFPEHSGLLGSGGKAARKVRWLSHGVLDLLVNGNTPSTAPDTFIQGGGVWLTPVERQQIENLLIDDERNIWKKQIVPHVTVDRKTQSSNLFHTGRVSFAPGCGLWFAVNGEIDWVRSALTELQDNGIGGLRSTGHGNFTWSEQDVDISPVKKGWGLTLSRYAPANQHEIQSTLQDPLSAFRLVTIGGWCQDDHGHSWRRRSVRMVEEGALLPAGSYGCLVDVRPLKPEDWLGPQRPVYRYGFAYSIAAGKLVEGS